MSKIHSIESWEHVLGKKFHMTSKKEAINFLNHRNIPTYNFYSSKFPLNWKEIKNFQKNSPFVAVLCAKNCKKHVYGLRNISQLKKFLGSFRNKNKCELMLIQQILCGKSSFVGTLVADGKGGGVIEILNYETADVRDLTSKGCNPWLLDIVRFYDYDRIINRPKVTNLKNIKKIIDYAGHYKGYFEFSKGILDNKEDIYFVDFQKNDSLIRDLLYKKNFF